MNGLKIKLLDELMHHMKGSQGMDLKSMLDKSKMPMEGSPMEERAESPAMESMEDHSGMGDMPKGMSIEKVSVMGKPKIPGISMGKHHRIAAPGPKDGDLQAMMDKKSAGVGPESPMKGDSDPEMSDDELKQLMSHYGM